MIIYSSITHAVHHPWLNGGSGVYIGSSISSCLDRQAAVGYVAEVPFWKQPQEGLIRDQGAAVVVAVGGRYH